MASSVLYSLSKSSWNRLRARDVLTKKTEAAGPFSNKFRVFRPAQNAYKGWAAIMVLNEAFSFLRASPR